jgi:hypothetical protein
MKPLSENENYLTATEARAYASRKTLYNYVKRGRLGLHKDYCGRNIYLRSDLDAVFGKLTLIKEKIDPEEYAKWILQQCAEKLNE